MIPTKLFKKFFFLVYIRKKNFFLVPLQIKYIFSFGNLYMFTSDTTEVPIFSDDN